MKRITFIAVIALSTLIFANSMFAQDPALLREQGERMEKTRRAQTAFETATNSSNGAKVLHERLLKSRSEGEFGQAISDVVQANDRSVVPYLKARLALYSEGKLDIEVALLHLGETEYFDKTVAELSSKDAVVRYYAVMKLSLFKTKEAYRKLLELLDDETGWEDHGDYTIPSLAYRVKVILAATVEDPPTGKDVYDTAAWKAWFEKHKELIQ